MNDFQQRVIDEFRRVIDELRELTDKLEKLSVFTQGPIYKNLPADEMRRLSRQYLIMTLYQGVLTERVDAWPSATDSYAVTASRR
jgi:hypothetical protein